MKLTLLIAAMALFVTGPASAQALIVWSGETKACGKAGFSARTGYSIEYFPSSDRQIISDRRKALKEANREAGGGWFWSDLVPYGSCVAVATAHKTVNGCSFSTTVWRTGKSEAEAIAAIEALPAKESSIKDLTIEKVQCAERFNNDTMFGVRG